MKKTFQTLVIGASMAVGVSAIATNPAHAGTMTGVTIGGTASSDYFIYDASNGHTFKVPNTSANLKKVLDGNVNNPTGNVELRASSEQSGFDFSKNTTLSGTIGGKSLTLSSLTLSDWTSSYKGTTFGQYWFNQALSANGFGTLVGSSLANGLFSTFSANGGFQRFSDPNISYVNQNNSSGLISIGLAGHLNATPLLTTYIDQYFDPLIAKASGLNKTLLSNTKTGLKNSTIQASEIVKYSYDGTTDYLFSFQATDSHLTEISDGISHSGNYEVTIQGNPQPVPEPSFILSMLGVAGIFATQRKLKKVSG